jgi:hypothetical protein
MSIKTTGAAAAIAGLVACGFASQSHAATIYYLDVDGCTGGCGLNSYGTVTVTTDSGFTEILITLAPNVYFDPGDNGLDAAAFDVIGAPTLTTQVMTNGFQALSPHTASGHTEGPFGNFQYAVDWQPSAGQSNLQSLDFRISTNFSAVSLGSTTYNSIPLYMSVDIERKVDGAVVSKGVVGASLDAPRPSAAPEPASWALMIGGFGLAGAGLRRRRQLAV